MLRRRRVLPALLLTMLPLAGLPRDAVGAGQTLLLDMQVNGRSIGKIGEFTLRDEMLMARREELIELGLRVPAAIAAGADGLVALSDLPQVAWRLSQASQTLHLTVSEDGLLPTLLLARTAPSTEKPGVVESSIGATLNYAIAGTVAGRQTLATGLLDFRAFSPWGVLTSGVLAAAGGVGRSQGNSPAIRLDTTYTYSDPDSLRRYRLGDFITGGLAWTRPVRFGGAQITSDFSLRPDLVTFPLPSVSGSVAVPSTVDVLANGTRLFSRQVDAGPFEIQQLPVVTGAGTVAMTLTNALGRQVVTTLPFYASSALLAPGLQSFSAQMGAVRQNWGLLSNAYGRPAASAAYRRGLTPALTIETTLEATAGTVMGGAGVVVNVGNLAVLTASAAASTGRATPGEGRSGTQIAVGLQRTGTVLSLGGSATVASRGFRDIAAVNGDPVPRLQVSASAGLALGALGSVGIAYAGVDRRGSRGRGISPGFLDIGPVGGLSYLPPVQRAHILTASYSVQLQGVGFYATGFRDFANRGSAGVLFGLTIPLGARSAAGASMGAGAGGLSGQVQAAQSPVSIGDVGFQAVASGGAAPHAFGQLQYKSPWALLTAGADRTGRQTALRTEAQGAVSLAGGAVFASNTIEDSFAVIDTNGLRNVRVLFENRDAGRTDSAGRLLVPDLRAFSVNHIGIEPTDIPPDTTIPVTTREVRPQDRSGVVVRFGVQASRGALLHLVDEAGRPLPVGSIARLQATGTAVPVGYDGAAFVEGLAGRNALMVEGPGGGRCGLSFDFHPSPGEIPVIGPLQCRVQAP